MADNEEPTTPPELNGFWIWMSKNWAKALLTYVVPVFVFLGGVTYFEEIRDEAISVWNMPKDGARAIAKSDSIHIVFRAEIDSLTNRLNRLDDENRILKRVIHHTTLGLSQETDPMQYKGIRFNATNPHYSTGLRTNWLFIDDKEHDVLVPYELKYNVQFDGYEYVDYVRGNKIVKLTPAY